jgi:hypothetical protein
MTDNNLATLLREHVRAGEPPVAPSSDRAIALGRRRLARRRAGLGVGCFVVAAAVTATAVVLPGHQGSAPVLIDPATAAALEQYDADRMPALIDAEVRPVLERSVHDLRPGSTVTAADERGLPLGARHRDRAASMTAVYTAGAGHTFRVYLAHAGAEAEGRQRQACAQSVADGEYFSCTVERVGGDTVITSVGAVRLMADGEWAMLTRGELRTGRVVATDADQDPVDRGQVYFRRNVKVIHSQTFVTDAAETLRAPDPSTAGARWQVPVADLQQIATDPVLVIPPPGGAASR